MKVLTLHQPWASLVALGVKTIETRSWSTKYRGPLAIHAGAKAVSGLVGDYRAETWFSNVQHVADCYCDAGEVDYPCQRGSTRTPCLTRLGSATIMLPLGAIVATCTLVDVALVGEWDSFRTGYVEGDEGDLPGRPVIVRHSGRDSLSFSDSLVLDHEGQQTDVSDQLPYGDFTPGRYALLLADVVPVDPPVPFKGGQGLTKTWEP